MGVMGIAAALCCYRTNVSISPIGPRGMFFFFFFISDRLGFGSPRYFTRCFKAQFEITPAEYRKKTVI